MKKLILALALSSLAIPAHADDLFSGWFVRAGIAELNFSHKLSLAVGGQPVPGAALKFHQIYTPIIMIGRNITDDFSIVASMGGPPTTSAYGSGSLAPYGKIEGATFGPVALTAQFQPFHDGLIRPYIGAGISYMYVFNTNNGAVTNPKLSNDAAPVVEAGTELALTEPFGLFIEAKKSFLTTHTGGTIGGYPVTGKASIMPWVFSVGGTVHF